jgi:hypothetical protein
MKVICIESSVKIYCLPLATCKRQKHKSEGLFVNICPFTGTLGLFLLQFTSLERVMNFFDGNLDIMICSHILQAFSNTA